jgi:ribosomal protein S18 acetylase RimI-like enzyme
MNPTSLRSMQSLSQDVWRCNPALVNTDATLGELAWSWGSEEEAPDLVYERRQWTEDDRVVAWAYIVPPQLMTISAERKEISDPSLVQQTHPERPDLLDCILDWFEVETPDSVRRTSVRAANIDALARLRARGYDPDPGAPWHLLNARDLREIEEPTLPPGYRLKTMRDVNDIPRRVAVHQAAWNSKRVTEESYERVMRTWPYRDDLDFVVEAPDGTLVASAIAWYDEEDGTGEFEPVGTHPEHRQRGIGRALMLFGCQRLRDAGATRAIVACRGDDDYPIPKMLYESAGFREISRDLPMVKR